MNTRELLCVCPDANRLADLPLPGWSLHVVDSLPAAARVLRGGRYCVALLDLPCADALTGEFEDFLIQHRKVRWVGIVDAGLPALPECRRVISRYLSDFHTRPLDPQRLAHTLGHLHGHAMLDEAPSRGTQGPIRVTGCSPAIEKLREQIRKVAGVDAPVLIWGESGSGKELAAQAIHDASPRARGPFVPINCGAIPPNLIQSELFGHVRGAFTGATRDKAGLIESACGGTIFLDEIADLPKDLQANLLRFLQEKTIYRIGATRSISVDVRVVAASHVNLQEAVAEGAFREDLYYRLSVLPLQVPPLRERREDLMMLAEELFRTYAADGQIHVRGFSECATAAILRHDWPGNVRELINRIRYAMVMADGRLVTAEDLGLATGPPGTRSDGLEGSRERAERSALESSLERCGRNVSRAARTLGVSRTTMYRLMAKHAVRK